MLQPDMVSYTKSNSACEKYLQCWQAFALLGEMLGRLLQPGMMSYNASNSACEKCRQW